MIRLQKEAKSQVGLFSYLLFLCLFILGVDHLAAILILSHDFDLIAFYHLPYDPVFLTSLGEEFS